jgi:hypothetical protein
MASADAFVYLDDVQYRRRGWQNRNKVRTPRGLAWLTIPVRAKGRRGQKIREVETAGRQWAQDHRETLRRCYARTPHFGRYEAFLDAFYARPWPRLLDACLELDRFVRAELGVATPLRLESETGSAGRGTERILSLCRLLGADAYLSGPAGRRYLDPEDFRREGVRLLFQEFSPPPYPQRFGPYQGPLALLDALFNRGPAECRSMISDRILTAC